jgi:hypothetical protein
LGFFWPSEVTKMHIFRLKMPFLVPFGLNLGLNNLKFGQKAISDRIDSIGSTRSDRSDLLKNDDYNRYFCLLHVNLIIFVLISGLSSFAFPSAFVLRNFREHETID